MIAVKVTYTVKPEYVAQNQKNIDLFLKDFQQMDSKEFRYNVYLSEDGTTFMHFSHFKNEEIQKEVLAVPSFVSFQKQRDDSGLEGSHRVEVMQLLGVSNEMFA